MFAMKPTPQESFSSDGSYRPSASGRQVCNSLRDARSAGFGCALADSLPATMCSRSKSDPLILRLPVRVLLSSAHLERSAAPHVKFGGHRSSSKRAVFSEFRLSVQRPWRTSLPGYLSAPGAELSLQSPCRVRNEIRDSNAVLPATMPYFSLPHKHVKVPRRPIHRIPDLCTRFEGNCRDPAKALPKSAPRFAQGSAGALAGAGSNEAFHRLGRIGRIGIRGVGRPCSDAGALSGRFRF